ncbi:hypothetical protein [Kitasatospora purpeofusca]|uniref:hypothetical protein n=1 Tax=Kitasatospora purpeofusca TaxID=67352 RepID=UPI0038084E23
MLGEEALGRLAVAPRQQVGGVEGVADRLARQGRIAAAGGVLRLEQEQPVVPQQLLAEHEELGHRRVVGQATGQPRFTPGHFGGRSEGLGLLLLLPGTVGFRRARLRAAPLAAPRQLRPAHRARRPAEQHRLRRHNHRINPRGRNS